MKKGPFLRRAVAMALAITVLAGGAYALSSSDSLISLSYLTDTFFPKAVEQGSKAAGDKLQESYDGAKKELDALGKSALADLGAEGGLYSANFASRTVSRGDGMVLPAGSGLLFIKGSGGVSHNGSVIDVTDAAEVSSGGALKAGHRYLVAEDTTATFTVSSGVAYLGVQGNYEVVSGGVKAAPFVDISSTDWFSDGVDYVYFQGLLTGTSDDTFAPNLTMSRAMMMTVFYRMAGSPEGEMNAATANFTDVVDGMWFAPFVRWAAGQGVTAGTGPTTFSPNENVTRQQVVVMMYGFATTRLGLTLPGSADLSVYSDRGDVATWGEQAMSWAVSNGIMSASDGKLMPNGEASRAQVALMVKNFSETYL